MLCLILAGAMHDVSSAVSSKDCCYSIEGGAVVARGVPVWDIIRFQFLLASG